MPLIDIKGARVHNLKHIDLQIPRNQLVVITGLSGSGKSSLAFDTLYAEGQRRYVESLSAYARQFLGRINKPEVDYIKGIPPAIAIEQKVNTRNPRSTVGTSTEIYDYLKLLYARIGETFSPKSGKPVKRHQVEDVVTYIAAHHENTRCMILAPTRVPKGRPCIEHLEVLLKQGFTRIQFKEEIFKIADILKEQSLSPNVKKIDVVIDRLAVKHHAHTQSRLADSVQTAFYEGKGECIIKIYKEKKAPPVEELFSNRFEADGIEFEEPTVHTFSFNNPIGACPTCEGFGKVMGIDEDLVVPNKSLSVFEDAIACWRGEKMSWWKKRLLNSAHLFDFPIHRPYSQLSEKHRRLLWKGNQHFEGLHSFFAMLEKENYKIQYRVMLSRYRGKTTCPDCNGTRLKKEASYVKIGRKSIHQLVLMPIAELRDFFKKLKLTPHQTEIARRLLIEINSRLMFLLDVGLGYLTLNRLSSSLSGGESQRINLATSLGSSLVGSLYILDEPSIGLHPRDTARLLEVLKRLKKIGNTVLIVEHDEETIRAADHIIDIGPLAGRNGGEVVFQGKPAALLKAKNSLTTDYLTGKKQIPIPGSRRKWTNYIEALRVRENNLKNISVRVPLNVFTVVTGVSGSGKSSLLNRVLYAALKRQITGYGERAGKFDQLRGDIDSLTSVEFVDQNPIGKSSRSNPVTYIKAYDEIRKLFASQQASKINGFKPAHFSFNVEGGRCEECQGEGTIKVEMQFMADVHLLCEQCNGKRFKDDVLDVTYHDKSIYDVLEMTINQALEFFSQASAGLENKIVEKLRLLDDVGLGYVKLGQASSTLSGGESQRIKLASFLGKEKQNSPSLFIFDEPTTGLHFHDILKLLKAFDALIERGHSVWVIEHNPEIIKSADWVIDLGPEGGKNGGNIVCQGTPEDIARCENSYTGKFLKEKLNI